jgi:hypothetical protein
MRVRTLLLLLLLLLVGVAAIIVLLWHAPVRQQVFQRDWQARKAALHAWAAAEQQEWQRKIAAQEADDAAYMDAARLCANRLTGRPEHTSYDEAFVGLTEAEKLLCFPFRRLRLTVEY